MRLLLALPALPPSIFPDANVMLMRTLPNKLVSMKLGLADPKKPSHVSMVCLLVEAAFTPSALTKFCVVPLVVGVAAAVEEIFVCAIIRCL